MREHTRGRVLDRDRCARGLGDDGGQCAEVVDIGPGQSARRALRELPQMHEDLRPGHMRRAFEEDRNPALTPPQLDPVAEVAVRSGRNDEGGGARIACQHRIESGRTAHRFGDEDDGLGQGVAADRLGGRSGGRAGRRAGVRSSGRAGRRGGVRCSRRLRGSRRQVEAEFDSSDYDVAGHLGQRQEEPLRVPDQAGQSQDRGVGHAPTVVNARPWSAAAGRVCIVRTACLGGAEGTGRAASAGRVIPGRRT